MREVTVSFSGSENVIDKIKRENALRVSRGQISFAKGSNNKELEEAIVEISELKDRVVEFEATTTELADLKVTHDELVEAKGAIDGELETLTVTHTDLETEFVQFKADHEAFVETAKTDTDTKNTQLDDLKVELEILKSDNETIMKGKVKLEGDVKILDEKLAAKEAKLKLLDKELKDTKKLITK